MQILDESKSSQDGRLKVLNSEDEWEVLKDGGGLSLTDDELLRQQNDRSNDNRFYCPALHIDLRNESDLLLLCPLSANTLAKLSHGLCDDTLSCTVRAWDLKSKSCVLVPAMNDMMWTHPLTSKQLDTLQSFWNESGDAECLLLNPVCKTLACGSVGMGALPPIEAIISKLNEATLNQLLTNTTAAAMVKSLVSWM